MEGKEEGKENLKRENKHEGNTAGRISNELRGSEKLYVKDVTYNKMTNRTKRKGKEQK
jgi:hypothetical protein